MKRDIYTGMKRTWVRQQAKEFAITGAFENFDKVVQAMQLSGVEGGLDAGDVLKDQRTTINLLCTRSRRNMNRTRESHAVEPSMLAARQEAKRTGDPH